MNSRSRKKAPLPDTFEGIKTLIVRSYPEYRGQMKRIAEHAIENPNDMALMTVAQIAEDIGVQPSSMVRFAKGLGYDGFSDIQKVFRTRLTAGSPSYAERIRSHRRGHDASSVVDAPDSVLSDFVAQGITSLEILRAQTPPAKVAEAVSVLADAKDIYLLAQRRAFPVAFYMSYALSRLDRRCILLDGVGGLLSNQAALATPDDAIVAVSFRPYAPEVAEIAAERGKAGVPIVSITDSALSPLALESTVSFEVHEHEDSGFRTLVAPMCLAQSLVVSLGHHLEAR